MIDRLTKKRVKVDYLGIINMLGLYNEYLSYVVHLKHFISQKRRQLAFLRSKKVDIYFCNHLMTADKILTYDQLLLYAGGNFQIIQDCCYEL